MSNDLAPPPSPVRKSSFPWWVIGCGCTGCFLFLLLTVGGSGLVVYSGIRVWKEGADETVQKQTFEAVIPSTDTPPGFRIAWANTGPWPISSYRAVIFVPENLQGDVAMQIRSSETFAILLRAPENDRERAERDVRFEKGHFGTSSELPAILEAFGADESQSAFRNMKTGTLSGHRFPLRYIVSERVEGEKVADESVNTESNSNESPASERRSRGRRSRETPSVAMVDLTPPESRDYATVLFLMRRSREPFTADFLAEFCKNFRPGQ